MIGAYQMTSWDLDSPNDSVRSRAHRDSIAIGDYPSIAHRKFSDLGIGPEDFLEPGAPVQDSWPAVESGGTPAVMSEIDLSGILPDTSLTSIRWRRPFEVPYGAIVPVSLDGLLVPVAVSADDDLFNAIRMEPTWTALGQAAGLAAAQAVQRKIPVRDISVDYLRRKLHQRGAKTFYASDVERDSEFFQAVQYFGNLGFFHASELVGTSTVYPAPVSTSRSQWLEAVPYHDTIVLERTFDEDLPGVALVAGGDFDENLIDADQVRRTASGSNLTIEQFETIVEAAAVSGEGGVIDFETPFDNAPRFNVEYGADTPLEISSSFLLDTESSADESISGTGALDAAETAARTGWTLEFDPPLEVFGIVAVDDDGAEIAAEVLLESGETRSFGALTADGEDTLFAYAATSTDPIVGFRFTSSHYVRWDDLGFMTTLSPSPEEETKLSGALLTSAVEAYWRQCYELEFGEGSLSGFTQTADGTITRGEYLQALFRYTVPDTDLDRLPDKWEIDRHGSIELYDGSDDVDDDGESELLEVATDGELGLSASAVPLLAGPYEEQGRFVIDLHFRKATEPGENQLEVERSFDLSPDGWELLMPDGNEVIEYLVDPDPDGDGSSIQVAYQIEIEESSALFFRLSVYPAY